MTPIFDQSQQDLWPIVESAVGEAIADFTVSIEHDVQDCRGYCAAKLIPTFNYTTGAGRRGKITVFVKYMWGMNEAENFAYLLERKAPVPRLYGVLTDRGNGNEILFMEYLGAIGFDVNSVEEMRQLLSMMAQFNAMPISGEYAARLPRHDPGPWLKEGNADDILSRVWTHGRNGDLGDGIGTLCRGSYPLLTQFQRNARTVGEHLSGMKTGLIHRDFGHQNVGWRGKTMLAFDLHKVSIGPRFWDAKIWLGTPDAHSEPERFRLWNGLSQHYLDELARYGGPMVSMEEFHHEVTLLEAGDYDLNWRLERSLDGQVDWTDDREEGKRRYRSWLYDDLKRIIAQAEILGSCF